MISERLKKQLDFLVEIDKVKSIFRMSYIADGSRHENDAEHSWHLAIMAFLLSDYIKEDIDICKVIKMVLIHDLIEIYAGDTFAFDKKANEDKEEREIASANKLFSILPQDQGVELRAIWNEFEECKTREAEYANMLDRIQPLLLNYVVGGGSWTEHKITAEQIYKRHEITLSKGPQEFKDLVNFIVDECVEKGILIK